MTAPIREGAAAPLQVLLVDDNATVRRSLSRILEAQGLHALTAENGAVALLALEGRSFDAILCDIMMPIMDGMTFYDGLAAERPEQARRVIFISAWADEPLVREFLDRVGQPVLPKPFDLPVLVEAIRGFGAAGTDRRSGRDRRMGPDRRGRRDRRQDS